MREVVFNVSFARNMKTFNLTTTCSPLVIARISLNSKNFTALCNETGRDHEHYILK